MKRPDRPNSKRPLFIALAAFLVIGIFALTEALSIEREQQETVNSRFTELTNTLSAQLNRRIRTYEYGLRGARGIAIANAEALIPRQIFREYMRSRELDREFPGARGFGFIRRVPQAMTDQYVQSVREAGQADFALRELSAHSNERMVIEIIEPISRNAEAVGLDIASELNRRSAAMRALLSGEPSLTDPITLVQASGNTDQGLLFLLPVYHSGMPTDTVEQRRAAAYGFSYAPLLVSEVLNDPIFESEQFSISIEDSDVSGRSVLMFSNATRETTGLRRAVSLDLYGQQWLLTVSAKQSFVRSFSPRNPLQVGIEISIIGALFSMLVYAFMLNKENERRAFIDRSRMAAIVESSADAIISEDLEGYITSWNEAAARIFGYPAEQALGYRLSELIYAEDETLAHEAEEILGQIREGLPMPPRESIRRRSNGQLIEVSVGVAPILEADGTVVGAAHTIQDMTELHRTGKMFKLALEASSTALLMVNEHGRIALANRRAEQLLGFDQGELADLSVSRLVPISSKARHEQLVMSFISNPEERRMNAGRDLSVLRKDGELVPVEINLNPVDTPDGRMVLTSIHDISHRVEFEQDIERSLNRFKLALDAAGIGIWTTEMETGETVWDDTMFNLFGIEREANLPPPSTDQWQDLIFEADQAEMRRRIADFRTSAEMDIIYRARRKNDGDLRWFRTVAGAERDDDGKAVRIIGTTCDITESKRTETSIREMNIRLSELIESRTSELRKALSLSETARRANSSFLANMSYDIRTPMNAILGICYLLVNRTLPPEERAMIEKIQASGNQLLGTINDILDLARIQAGSIELAQVEFELESVLGEALARGTDMIADKPVEIRMEPIPPDCRGVLLGDRGRLLQIIVNLLANAVRLTPAGGVSLHVESRPPRNGAHRKRLLITVEDTGIGIAPEHQDSVFEIFTGETDASNRRRNATDLGLSISRMLVELMGGSISFKSELDHGSTFFFELEFDQAGAAESIPTPATPVQMADGEPRALSGLSILMIDDNPMNLEVQQNILQQLGASVSAIDNAHQALMMLRAEPTRFDAILMDIQMPDIDGLEATKLIRSDARLSHLPIIAVTAGAFAHQQETALEAGMNAVVTKPINIDVLIGHIQRVCKRA